MCYIFVIRQLLLVSSSFYHGMLVGDWCMIESDADILHHMTCCTETSRSSVKSRRQLKDIFHKQLGTSSVSQLLTERAKTVALLYFNFLFLLISFFVFVFCLFLPGHLWVLQLRVSLASPNPLQSLPRFAFGGFVQVRTRCRTPPPHDLLQEDLHQLLHCEYPP